MKIFFPVSEACPHKFHRTLAVLITLLACLVLTPLKPLGASQPSGEKIENISHFGDFVMKDGMKLRIAGLFIPDTKETAYRLSGDTFTVTEHPAELDRHGFVTGELAFTKNNQSLKTYLLEKGWAVLDPRAPFDEPALFNLEKKEALQKLTRDAATLKKTSGFALVEGTIHTVTERKAHIFVNFSDDWRSDFTIMIDKAVWDENPALHALAADKKVTIRGWLTSYYGPMIKLESPHQIKIH